MITTTNARHQNAKATLPVTMTVQMTTPAAASTPPVTDPAARLVMINVAAYFLAERRGFCPGHELDDWLAAEKQIDLALTAATEAGSCVPPGEASA